MLVSPAPSPENCPISRASKRCPMQTVKATVRHYFDRRKSL